MANEQGSIYHVGTLNKGAVHIVAGRNGMAQDFITLLSEVYDLKIVYFQNVAVTIFGLKLTAGV